jgi:hypothetical protein
MTYLQGLLEKNDLHVFKLEEAQKIFSELNGLTLKSIIESVLTTTNQGTKIDSFLDGESTTGALEDLKRCLESNDMESFTHSLRITNLEKSHPLIQKFCRKIYQESGLLLTCGVYITPHELAQCFLYHSDHQYLFIYQLQGEKRWSFPIISDSLFREYDHIPTINSKINQKTIPFTTKELNLGKEEALFIPYALSHRAYNDQQTPSVHLTFASEDVTIREAMTFIVEDLYKLSNIEEQFFGEFNELDLPENITGEQIVKVSDNVEAFFTKTKMLKFKFGLKA